MEWNSNPRYNTMKQNQQNGRSRRKWKRYVKEATRSLVSSLANSWYLRASSETRSFVSSPNQCSLRPWMLRRWRSPIRFSEPLPIIEKHDNEGLGDADYDGSHDSRDEFSVLFDLAQNRESHVRDGDIARRWRNEMEHENGLEMERIAGRRWRTRWNIRTHRTVAIGKISFTK